MIGTGRSGAGAATIAVVAFLAMLAPGQATVAAADQATVLLPGTTYSVMTVDLDGDGSRELLRIVSEPSGGNTIVEAWAYGPGGWGRLGSADLLRQDEAGDGMIPVTLGRDAAALLAWRADGRERVLVVTAGGMLGASSASTCCLSIAEFRGEDGGIALHPMPAPDLDASLVEAADLDADGTDELVLVEFSPMSPRPERLGVLRWNGSAFEVLFEREDFGEFRPVGAGDTDGVWGDELLLGPTAAGRLERIAWIDGEPLTEATDLNPAGSFDGWFAGLADGAMMIAAPDGLRVLRWPRGGDATEVARLDSLLFPSLYTVGHGPDALIISYEADAIDAGALPTATVHDLALRPLGEVEAGPAAAEVWKLANDPPSERFGLDRPIFPYIGPIPTGWPDGRPAFVANGVLILAGGAAGFETLPIATLAGLQPVGVAGPDGEWMALTNGFLFSPSQQAYLFAGPGPPGAGGVTLVPLESLLQPDEEVATPSLELRNAVETAAAVDGVRPLLASGDGFEVVVTAAPGSRVLVADDWRSEQYEVGNGPLVAEVRTPRIRQVDKNQPLEASLIVVSPEGRVSTTSWKGTFVRELPELSISASTETLALRARLEGQASPGVTVTANGQALETDHDGRFVAAVDAPLWPSTVVVTARDPLGNETRDRVEVVGFVDYRGLPWPAFVVVATIVAGAVLYIRVPRPRTESGAAAPDGGARLEEIEADD